MKLPSFRVRLSSQVLLMALVGSAGFGCSSSDDDTAAQKAVVDNYAAMVAANYADTLSTAKSLKKAIHSFVDAPSEDGLKEARDAWLASRDPYGLSEAYRFSQGPIDNDDSDDDVPEGPEPLLNSWPVDESYIDYVRVVTKDEDEKEVVTYPDGGIINLPDEFPTIDADALSGENTKHGEDEITTGYHAIEFLLWGQDFNVDGPGDRSYTDYVVGEGGTHANQDRRGQYLVTLADLMVDELSVVNDAWLEGKANYRADFVALPPASALGKILLGMGSLSGAELSGERMSVALDEREQEAEHSCFSDNTLADLRNNATSIQNVLIGHYGDIQGPGIADLIEKKDAALAKALRDDIQRAIDDIDAVPPTPFDQAIMADDDDPARKHLLDAVDALHRFTPNLKKAADTLGVSLNLQSK
ncbi:MAG TPA: imelysin family protein [Polyangiaceae bacterium]|nr:imelysin family protein [Polyangiaceae bacterium]